MKPSDVKLYLVQRNGGEADPVERRYYSQRIDDRSEVVAQYDFNDEKGELQFRKLRYANADGSKGFSYQSKRDGIWKNQRPEMWLLYRLPELVAAGIGTPVFVTEGEKDADTLARLGLVVTTAPQEWQDHFNDHFADRTVFIMEDNDDPGRRKARKVARALRDVAEEVRIIPFTDLAEGEDVTDFIEAGGGKEELLGRCAAAPNFRDEGILMLEGQLSEIVTKTEAGLIKARVDIFQRGGELVRLVHIDQAPKQDEAVRRPLGTTIIATVREAHLHELLARHMEWSRIKVRGENSYKVVADPHPKYARTLMARGEWDFRPLFGIRTAPTLDLTGRIIEKPGYDATSGLFLDFKPGLFPSVPEHPTQDDAKAALGKLAHVLRGFPFDSQASLSVALSAFLTALVRPSMATAPLHGFDAPAAGTGKSMLAEMPGLLASGLKPPAMAQGKTAEETEKRMAAVLMAGDPTILLDNCELPVEGDLICSVLTQTQVQVRILGRSEMSVLPSTALIIATGNNLTFQGDMTRRAVICRLDAKQERPDARQFDFDAQQELLRDRPALLVGLLAALRAYKLAGGPVKLTPMGSFADYDWPRGVLVWCGYADPADTRLALLESDPRKNELAEVMALWDAALGRAEVTVASIAPNAGQPPMTVGLEALQYALMEATNSNGHWNARKVGRWLLRQKDRVVGNRAFRKTGNGAVVNWSLAALAEKHGEGP